jgi:hypothetical protein
MLKKISEPSKMNKAESLGIFRILMTYAGHLVHSG